MTSKDHRDTLNRTMKREGLNQKQVAELLSRETGDQIVERTVYHWTSARDTTNARPCPGWVIVVLKLALEKKAK